MGRAELVALRANDVLLRKMMCSARRNNDVRRWRNDVALRANDWAMPNKEEILKNEI